MSSYIKGIVVAAVLVADVYYYDLEGKKHVCGANSRVLVMEVGDHELLDVKGRIRREKRGLIANHRGVWFDIDSSQFIKE